MDDQNTQGNSLGGSTIDTLWTGLGLEVLLTFLSLILIQNNWQKQKTLVNLSTRAKKFLAGGIVLNCKAPITSAHPGPPRDRKQVWPSHFFETKNTNNSGFWVFFLKAEIVDQLQTLSCVLISLSCGLIKNGMFFRQR